MDNFANIGKAVLIQALGIQKNYTEIIEDYVDVIDHSNTCCQNCKFRAIIENFDNSSDLYKQAMKNCLSCTNHTIKQQTITKKIYHNEKNQYGYRPMLKSNSIKLFLSLHFYHPDKFGIIKNVDPYELSELLNCNIKTIHNNLEILSNYEYISYSKHNKHNISIVLNDYEKYYLPANKGGRGFIVMSKDLITELINISSLLSLRIYLRELINLDNNNMNGIASVDYKDVSELRKYLPTYCKPCIIKKNFMLSNSIFKVEIDNNTKYKFIIDSKYIAKYQKNKLMEQYTKDLSNYIKEINTYVPVANVRNDIPDTFQNVFNYNDNSDFENAVIGNTYKFIKITDVDIDDLALLAVHHSFDLVCETIISIYHNYILSNRPIKNFGALANYTLHQLLDEISNVA